MRNYEGVGNRFAVMDTLINTNHKVGTFFRVVPW